MTSYLAFNIGWDIDSEEAHHPPKLPSTVIVEVDDDDSGRDTSEVLSDSLSDDVGYTHHGFDYLPLDEAVMDFFDYLNNTETLQKAFHKAANVLVNPDSSDAAKAKAVDAIQSTHKLAKQDYRKNFLNELHETGGPAWFQAADWKNPQLMESLISIYRNNRDG